ncbi:MAG TPA: hypothetical protein VLV78_03425 [Thermoanaerobaculia bacterium]|nr:hypothetical protein [Thermoanaerobaculia bacterium]
MRKLIVLAAFCAATNALHAQNTDIESLAGLLFNFGNPGARALGMGGAFIGLADDASAVEANPAGLTILRKPEVSLELRNNEEQQFLTTSGTYPDVMRTGFSLRNHIVQFTFASVVYPLNNFVIGGYYHEPLRNQVSGEVLPAFDPLTGSLVRNTPNFYLPRNGPPVSRAECDAIRARTNDPFACLEYTLYPFVSTLDLKERTLGFVGAYKVRDVSFGLAVRYQRLTEVATSADYNPATFELTSLRVQAAGHSPTAQRSENKVAVTAGMKWMPTEKIGVGAVYKQGPRFPTTTQVAEESTGFEFVNIGNTTFHVPDIYGAGVALRPIPVVTLTSDVVRVKYSNLSDKFYAFNEDFNGDYKVSDATELHLGAEYFIRTNVPVALRAGWWHDPAHSLEYRGPLTSPERVAAAMLFPKGTSRSHQSVGAGMAWPWFEIDTACDWSKNYLVVSLSMVKRFEP